MKITNIMQKRGCFLEFTETYYLFCINAVRLGGDCHGTNYSWRKGKMEDKTSVRQGK